MIVKPISILIRRDKHSRLSSTTTVTIYTIQPHFSRPSKLILL